MAKQITAWQANDGSVHDTQQQAESRDAALELKSIMKGVIFGYDADVDWHELASQRRDLASALSRWDGKAP